LPATPWPCWPRPCSPSADATSPDPVNAKIGRHLPAAPITWTLSTDRLNRIQLRHHNFAGNLTDQPEVRYTEGGIARAMFRVAVSGRREQEPSFFTVVVWRDQAEHAAESLSKGSRVVVVGRLQQRSWTAEAGSARSTVEVVAEELGPSLRWATATTTRATRSQDQ
jgi:single-strand DNA-binding protein